MQWQRSYGPADSCRTGLRVMLTMRRPCCSRHWTEWPCESHQVDYGRVMCAQQARTGFVGATDAGAEPEYDGEPWWSQGESNP
jgi:hypothetical protein